MRPPQPRVAEDLVRGGGDVELLDITAQVGVRRTGGPAPGRADLRARRGPGDAEHRVRVADDPTGLVGPGGLLTRPALTRARP